MAANQYFFEKTVTRWYNGSWKDGIAETGIFYSVYWSGGTVNYANMCFNSASTIYWYNGNFNGNDFGYSVTTNNTIPLTIIGPPRCDRRGYCDFNLQYSGSSASVTDTFSKLYITLAQYGIQGFTSGGMPFDELTWSLGGSYNIDFSGRTFSYSPVSLSFTSSSGFTGNWYSGSMYKGTFKGLWYGGTWYDTAIWRGYNKITNDYTKPTSNYVGGTSSNFETYEQKFMQENTNAPPNTNNYNNINVTFKDPTYFY